VKKAQPTKSCVGDPLYKSSSDRVSHDERTVSSLYIYARCVGCAPDTLLFFPSSVTLRGLLFIYAGVRSRRRFNGEISMRD
jgi:hypothetical protein